MAAECFFRAGKIFWRTVAGLSGALGRITEGANLGIGTHAAQKRPEGTNLFPDSGGPLNRTNFPPSEVYPNKPPGPRTSGARPFTQSFSKNAFRKPWSQRPAPFVSRQCPARRLSHELRSPSSRYYGGNCLRAQSRFLCY